MHDPMGEKHQRQAKNDKQRSGDLIDDGKCAQGELAAQAAGHHHFQHIGAHIYQQTNGKDYDPILKSMINRKYGSIAEPEEDDPGVEGIDNKS